MAVLPELGLVLFGAHEALRRDGINDRRLIKLLHQFGQAGHLPSVFASFEEGYNTLMLVSGLCISSKVN